MNYYEYIESTEWKNKSKWIKERRGNKCQVCGASGDEVILHTHHNCYDRLGKELDTDLVVLCADCHKIFHTNKKIVRNHNELPESKIFSILWNNGITYTNDDPWGMYGYGKQIIWEIVGRGNWKLFDRYNEINIKIVDEACKNMARREFLEATESDYYHDMSEYQIRCCLNFWEGWNE